MVWRQESVRWFEMGEDDPKARVVDPEPGLRGVPQLAVDGAHDRREEVHGKPTASRRSLPALAGAVAAAPLPP
jgi:hypothetical protein